MKTCRICSNEKQETHFYPHRRVCKTCHAAQGSLWKEANKKQWLATVAASKRRAYDLDSGVVLQRNQKWRAENKEWMHRYNQQYAKENPDIVSLSRQLRETSLKQRCVSWADTEAIKQIYKQAKVSGLEVDHIIPLQGEKVSGLHVENNLQLLTKTENRRKSNKYECDDTER